MTSHPETPQGNRAAEVSHEGRDQEKSAFSAILEALVSQVPGARAAAMVDCEGETVDYAGAGDPFRLRVTAAHWRIVLEHGAAQRWLQGLRWLAVRCGRRNYLVHALPLGYALVIDIARGAGFLGWDEAVTTCVSALCREAGWVFAPNAGLGRAAATPRRPNRRDPREVAVRWFPVDVIADDRHRPSFVRVGERLHPLEILGAIVRRKDRADKTDKTDSHAERATAHDLGRGSRAWRVRLDKGVEATVVRRPGGIWYADEPVDLLVQPR